MRTCGTRTDSHPPEIESSFGSMSIGSEGGIQIVSIPIVWHVVGNATVQNEATDAKIASQLLQLNQDFSGTNTDISNTPSVFIPRTSISDSRISFSTHQIIRTVTSKTLYRAGNISTNFNPCQEDMKFTSAGGSNAVDPTNYLNIWICSFSSNGVQQDNILGYAQFPWEASQFGGCWINTDGCVLQNGTIGSLTNPGSFPTFGLGRTLAHEIGHYLGLRHIWYDGDCGSGACCGGLDMPRQAGPNGGIPSHPHRAGLCLDFDGSPSPGDMFMNYMDYTDDAGMCMFSAGQKEEMILQSATYRQNFVYAASPRPTVYNLIMIDTGEFLPEGPDPALQIDINVQGTAIFNGGSSLNAELVGDAIFNDKSVNAGVVIGNAIFAGGSRNEGTVIGTTTCVTSGEC